MLFNMLKGLFFMLVLVTCTSGNAQQQTSIALLQDLADFVSRNDLDLDYDDVISNDDVLNEVKQILTDHGYDSDDVMSDISGFLQSIPSIFKSGDTRRWASINFGRQLACYAGVKGNLVEKSLWAAARFNAYGCYCGGGYYHGNYLDATDNCCRIHDVCYTKVQNKYKLEEGCHTYTTSYSVSCCPGAKTTKCTDSGPSAARELCECDQAMAKCVARNSGSYNSNLQHDRSQCQDNAESTKVFGVWDIIKSCKALMNTPVILQQTYGSQGSCPNGGEKKSGWFWGKRR